MAHLIHGTFPAVAGVFRTKGYRMDQTSNQGMSGYEAYKKQKQLAAALRQQEAERFAMQQLMQQQPLMQQQQEMQQEPQQLMQQQAMQQAPQVRTSGPGLIQDLSRNQLPYGEVYRRPR